MADGHRKPSSEYDMHRIFYQRRSDVSSVVHTHSKYAAEEIEFCAEVYYKSKLAGNPVLLSESDMTTVIEKFKTYGQNKAPKQSR